MSVTSERLAQTVVDVGFKGGKDMVYENRQIREY